MNTSKTENRITPKFPIEVPTASHLSTAAVYKVWFGKKYFIWKGKALLQSANQLAEGIERFIRTKNKDQTSWLYKICEHIKKTKCEKAKIEVIDDDFIRPGTVASLDIYRMLRVEQDLLHEAGNSERCLNNNEQAYIPKWMEENHPSETEKFLRNWKSRSSALTK